MTVKTGPVTVAPDQPTRRPFRNLPGLAPKRRHGTYSDTFVAQLRREKRDAEERSEHYARQAGHVEGIGKVALMYLRMGWLREAVETLEELEASE